MAKAPASENFFIPGPAGRLQALLETPSSVPESGPERLAIICHPHPLYEGTMYNKVVHTLARTMNSLGMPALRFNFRGVQDSEGEYGEVEGELQDLLAVHVWARSRWPGATLWLAGFSFGGLVAARAAAALRPEQLITIAPAITLLDDAEFAVPDVPWLIVQGEADDIVSPTAVRDWVAARQPGPELLMLPGVGHFFHGELNTLRALLQEKLGERGGAVAVEQKRRGH